MIHVSAPARCRQQTRTPSVLRGEQRVTWPRACASEGCEGYCGVLWCCGRVGLWRGCGEGDVEDRKGRVRVLVGRDVRPLPY